MRDEIISVIGGSGFLGRYTVKRLAAAGYRVRVLCRKPHLAHHLKPAGNVGQIVLEHFDLTKPESMHGKIANSHAVVNLVGLMHESGNQKFSRIHAQGAEKIAQDAKDAGAQAMVQVSALGIDKAHQSAYARTKLEGEKAVRAAFPEATILRPSVIFGPEDNFFNMFARMSRFSPFLPAIGGGKTKFQPVYVEDVAKTIQFAIDSTDMAGKTYELGGPHVYSFSELLDYVGKVTNRPRAQVPLPYTMAKVAGSFMQCLPNPLLTSDQVRLLQTDNVVDDQALGFKDLDIEPTALEAIVPTYLSYQKRAAA